MEFCFMYKHKALKLRLAGIVKLKTSSTKYCKISCYSNNWYKTNSMCTQIFEGANFCEQLKSSLSFVINPYMFHMRYIVIVL